MTSPTMAVQVQSTLVGETFQRTLRIVDEVESVASDAKATPPQEAMAWLLVQGDDIAPIPVPGGAAKVEETAPSNGGADGPAEQPYTRSRRSARRGEHGRHRQLIAQPHWTQTALHRRN